MKIKLFKSNLPILIISLILLISISCKDELNGPENPIDPPSTSIINIPVPNSLDNLYDPVLKVGWRGVSANSIVAGFWVSWKSEFLVSNEVVVQKPFFTNDVSQTIAFPSKDSLNKQTLIVKAEDQYGVIDPNGDSVVFYTSKTIPPVTSIEFPKNNSSAFIMDSPTITWKGVKLVCKSQTTYGAVKQYAVKIDNNEWSGWFPDSNIYLSKNNIQGFTAGKHKIQVKSRNAALVEDPNPAEIEMTFVLPTHSKEWLIVDDTNDQNGTIERPSDEQVDEFYERLLSEVQSDSWDITQDGMITKTKLGDYKYVLWHSDDHRKTSLPQAAGVLIDYLNTRGKLMISGWNYLTYFKPEGDWVDSIKYYGNFLTNYLHVNGSRTIEEALLDSVIIQNSNDSFQAAAIDTNKIWNFRNGLYKVMDFNNTGSFTRKIFSYHSADTTGNNFSNVNIGMGYQNSEYQLVVTGFPFYYLTNEAAGYVFRRSKEYLDTNFPF